MLEMKLVTENDENDENGLRSSYMSDLNARATNFEAEAEAEFICIEC